MTRDMENKDVQEDAIDFVGEVVPDIEEGQRQEKELFLQWEKVVSERLL
ncbi:hypothetical protein [Bacillus mycoides]|nr:hypothetical protein [Bacillus mycoides]MCQ6529048.1 hypothetical protein [Bacillus mycoides]